MTFDEFVAALGPYHDPDGVTRVPTDVLRDLVIEVRAERWESATDPDAYLFPSRATRFTEREEDG